MKNVGVGMLIVAIGIIFLYMAVTNKLDCFKGAFKCAFLDDKSGAQSKPSGTPGSRPASTQGARLPTLPRLPQLGV